MKKIVGLVVSAAGQKAGAGNSPAQDMALPTMGQAVTDFGRIPLHFIPNHGQMDERVAYYVQGKDKSLYFTPEGLTIVLTKNGGNDDKGSGPALHDRSVLSGEKRRGSERRNGESEAGESASPKRWVVKLDFVGANTAVKPLGAEKSPAVISYFKGNPEDWKTGLPAYSRLIYPELWPGIDLVYSGDVNRLKYEFIVHPGADPSSIRLAYRGITQLSVSGDGRLEVTTPAGRFLDEVPVAYQEVGGKREAVSLAYRVEDRAADKSNHRSVENNQIYSYSFRVGEYNSCLPLVLDPAIRVYCGYIGGSSDEYGQGIALDSARNVYVTGYTLSTESSFPVSVGPELTNSGSWDAFVAKVNASGTALLYCGYIGGSARDDAYAIAVDGSGNVYITGYTESSDGSFPVTVGPDLTFNGDEYDYDAFVAKVNAYGTALLYCGFIGGSDWDWGRGIAVDGSGNAYVTGHTYSGEGSFPVTVGPDLTFNGGDHDAFVAKVNASGAALSYCGYIGGSHFDEGRGIAVDGSGNAYITGYTFSSESSFPVTVGPGLTYGGAGDAFVAKVNASGAALSYCGYIGGSDEDTGFSIAIDNSGNAYVTGYAYSNEGSFPVTVGPDLTQNGWADAFVAKISASGATLFYCGYIGGGTYDHGYGIALDSAGNACITGHTASNQANFPVKVGPDLTFNDIQDAFVAKVSASGATLFYCGYIGGTGYDYSYGIAVDISGNVYVAGYTTSSESSFPVKVGPDLTHNGNADAYVAMVSAYGSQLPVFDGHDFDGNSTSEISVYRPTNGVWYINGLSDTQWGEAGDIPVPGNYDLDPATEIAIFRPTSGLWFISGVSTSQWGASGDIPVPRDYNGGGVTDLAVWRPSNGVWYINGVGDVQWGQEGDFLVPGDYDGDGAAEVAVWRPRYGEWFIFGGGYYQLGTEGDIPVPADYDGDGTTDVAVYRPSTGMWYIQYSGGGTAGIQWGGAQDIPVPGDYDGNGTTDVAIWRASTGLWFIYGGATTQYGIAGDVPLVR
jgi:hypothetical protein